MSIPKSLTRFAKWIVLPIILTACSAPGNIISSVVTPTIPTTDSLKPTIEPTQTLLVNPGAATPASVNSANLNSTAELRETGCSTIPLPRSVSIVEWSDNQSPGVIKLIDPESGAPLCGIDPLSIGQYHEYAFSPDRRNLAMVIFPDNNDPTPLSTLHLIDLEKWTIEKTTIEFSNWIWDMKFSPDGERLAIAYAGPPEGLHGMPDSYHLVLVDLRSQEIIADRSFNIPINLLEFLPVSDALAVYGSPYSENNLQAGDPQAKLLNSTSLETIWEMTLPGILDGQMEEIASDGSSLYVWWSPGLAFSPQRQVLYIVHADADRLTKVDFAHRQTTDLDIYPASSWLERFLAWTAGVAHAKILDGTSKTALLSADESQLFVSGRTGKTTRDSSGEIQFNEEPLGLQVIDVDSATQLAYQETSATEIKLSSDGEELYLTDWSIEPSTDVIEVSSLKPIGHLAGRSLVPSRRLDGEPVLIAWTYQHNGGASATQALLDPNTLKETSTWISNEYSDMLVIP